MISLYESQRYLSGKEKHKSIVDAAFAVIGYALGGVVGAGTIVCIALVGPVAGVFLPVNEKLVNRIVGEQNSDE